ncbi:MAG: PEP-CTERM sorting domain-containing protein [Acidobacteriota bacterium]
MPASRHSQSPIASKPGPTSTHSAASTDPGAWLDANVSPGASYAAAIGGVNNPIPTILRALISGPDSADPFAFASTFYSAADASGILTVYTWADPNNTLTTTQRASLLNGFQLGIAHDQAVPEPSTLACVSAGLLALAVRRRANRRHHRSKK